MFEVETVVIGAGVVGLATAQALARQGREVIVLEAEQAIGTQTSSRNSEVIHAGLYYPDQSLKAKLCVEGRRKLYDWLVRHQIAHRKCGKLAVAVNEAEAIRLDALMDQAERNEVEACTLISGQSARTLEPELSPHIVQALHSAETGVFDSHGYMQSLQGILEDHGGHIAFGAPVEAIDWQTGQLEVRTGGDMPTTLKARHVINAAGHRAIDLAALEGSLKQTALPRPRFVKGSYFTISGRPPFEQLIYPLHTAASLGVHYTRDMSGRGKIGPDAEWLPDGAAPPFDYQVDEARKPAFLAALQRYWPRAQADMLSPDYAGVRPKLVGEGEPSGDFQITPVTQAEGCLCVHLLGIESPGLTSSLAIADHVAELIADLG